MRNLFSVLARATQSDERALWIGFLALTASLLVAIALESVLA
jgi:hypothetical protein